MACRCRIAVSSSLGSIKCPCMVFPHHDKKVPGYSMTTYRWLWHPSISTFPSSGLDLLDILKNGQICKINQINDKFELWFFPKVLSFGFQSVSTYWEKVLLIKNPLPVHRNNWSTAFQTRKWVGKHICPFFNISSKSSPEDGNVLPYRRCHNHL